MKDEVCEQFNVKTYVDLTINDANPLAALNYKARFIPHMLYKYTSLPHNTCERRQRIRAMQSGLIWLSKRSILNDPLEFLRVLHFSADSIEKREYVTNVINNRVVFCLAQENDNKLMWSHYANAHKGYCVEYEVQNDYWVFPVEYTDSFPNYKDLLKQVYQAYDPLVNGDATTQEKKYTIALSAVISSYKDSCWKDEKEYRIHDTHFVELDDGASYKATALGIKINRIICGAECSEKDIVTLENICRVMRIGISKMDYSNDLRLIEYPLLK